MSNDFVGYSRAGDVFHYRWAARRCLQLIYPNTNLRSIVIEGSSEKKKEGEYVIDVSEYREIEKGKKKIDYYQLKHSTVQLDTPFILSDLKDTLIGFAKRFLQHRSDSSSISFSIITNRMVDDSLKQKWAAIIKNEPVDGRFTRTIEKYTGLTTDELAAFCSVLSFEDSNGDYDVQKDELRIELARVLAGSVDNIQVNNIVALVQEKVLPKSDHLVHKEDILRLFGITSEKALYPAPAVWEKMESLIGRKQYTTLHEKIQNSSAPVIIHAAGGVGKSVFCRHLVNSLSNGSLGIAYDCFGAGGYRSRTGSRHRHRNALVQIINELASKELCDPLLIKSTDIEEDIMRRFLMSIDSAVKNLRKISSSSTLFILIDAADNAEMAAKEINEVCFANELLKESIPDGCKLVLLCRTERISLLQPSNTVLQLELVPFSYEESLENLKKWFPKANEHDGLEFHRLTSGNPRVQANSFNANFSSISDLLRYLGPVGTSVEKQIELQLDTAVSHIKNQLTREFQDNVNAICYGLANLPPHVPIDILSKTAKVSIENVRSFVADIGRSLWLSDTSVQFRDEPTETWFRKMFSADKSDFEKYIAILEPIAHQSSYVAEVLPQLYLQAEQYQKLINIALSDDYLPENNPIEARNARVYRLQFAFKAALKSNNYKDAAKLAMRAGEETAGDLRQRLLLESNIDLLVALQSKEKVQETAFKRLLNGSWDGSENVYAASLLSGFNENHGEARGYLRAAINWLEIYYEAEDKKEKNYHEDKISELDILELTFAHYNLFGIEKCIFFLERFNPGWVYNVVKSFAKRLIDAEKFEAIDELLNSTKHQPYFTIAITNELVAIGKFPDKAEFENCLNLLCSPKFRIPKPKFFFNDTITPIIVSFLEACLYHNLDANKILKVLKYYVPLNASQSVQSAYQSGERTVFLKSVAIRILLEGKSEVDIGKILPKAFVKKEKDRSYDSEISEFKEVVNGMFPWFFLRAQLLFDKKRNLFELFNQTSEATKNAWRNRYRKHDRLPYEVSQLCASILICCSHASEEEILMVYDAYLKDSKTYTIDAKLDTIRAAYRVTHLSSVRAELELSTFKLIKNNHTDSPEEIANKYISLARSVVRTLPIEASAYFDEAIKVVSRFGDELVERWEAVTSLAERSCSVKHTPDELAYRFIRCAELVGENVSREKNWSRSEAIRICTKMSSAIGIAAVSRWRDREVGVFEYQLATMLQELVATKEISSSVGWSLARLFDESPSNKYLSICLEQESSTIIKQNILDDAVHRLASEGANATYWEELMDVAIKYSLTNSRLESVVGFYRERKSPLAEKGNNQPIPPPAMNSNEEKWDDIFDGIVITSIEGFSTLLLRSKSGSDQTEHRWYIRDLLRESFRRLEEKNLWDFIDVILTSDGIDYYDARFAFSLVPQQWKARVSFSAKWSSAIFRYGQKYASELTNEYSFRTFVEEFKIDDLLVKKFKAGIFSGLANGYELANASMFFGFVGLVSSFIDEESARELIDYSLSRFELHIEEEFGDGVWQDWLVVSNDIDENVAGFIWSALASPASATRWKAAHCIRKLVELNCVQVLDALILWLERDAVGSFGSHQFPFYNLHARQYLLIALARISLIQPEILLKYNSTFSKYALKGTHILIQKISSDIAINLEAAFPQTYNEHTLASIKNIGKSKLPAQEEDYNYSTDSYWHKNNLIDPTIKFNFGWDFERYWFDPLGDVFGLSAKQIEDLVADVIVNEWGLANGGAYNDDPRVILWNRSANERETWHDHGSYPRVDNLGFYLSYHAMMVVAAKLIDKMPIVSTRDWYDNEWDEWLLRHSLTNDNGKWLSDYKDALPLLRPNWILDEKNDAWQTNILEADFLNVLMVEGEETQIVVDGNWHEQHQERTERYSVSSALVSKETSDALIRALSTCENPYTYNLPYYNEDEVEIKVKKFVMTGWLKKHSISKRVDEFDPYADEINCPSYSLSPSVMEHLNLIVDSDSKLWTIDASREIALLCEIWSSYREKRDENADQSGMRLNASLSTLKQLCKIFDRELILDVRIDRTFNYKYGRGEKEEHLFPQHKTFIFSENGALRTIGASYQLGEVISR